MWTFPEAALRRWEKHRAAKHAASIASALETPPTRETIRASAKALVRLRERYPRASDATLEALARHFGGIF